MFANSIFNPLLDSDHASGAYKTWNESIVRAPRDVEDLNINITLAGSQCTKKNAPTLTNSATREKYGQLIVTPSPPSNHLTTPTKV